jgi:hypothetical protein
MPRGSKKDASPEGSATTPKRSTRTSQAPPLAEDVQRELADFRRQAAEAQQLFLREATTGSERLRQEMAATEEQLGQLRRQFQEAGPLLGELPRRAAEVRQRLDEVAGQLGPLEQGARVSLQVSRGGTVREVIVALAEEG